MTTKPKLCVYYWREDLFMGNLGDALVPILLDALGHDVVDQTHAGAGIRNAGRCLLVIGSLLTEHDLLRVQMPLEIWGCGWKGAALSPSSRARLRVHAVRGPHTVTGLELLPDTPLGDPALLLPRLALRRNLPHNRTLVMPHFLRADKQPPSQRCRLTGCDEMLSPLVVQMQAWRRVGSTRQAIAFTRRCVRQGIRPRLPWGAVERIAGADFVLTGSLHGADPGTGVWHTLGSI